MLKIILSNPDQYVLVETVESILNNLNGCKTLYSGKTRFSNIRECPNGYEIELRFMGIDIPSTMLVDIQAERSDDVANDL